MRGLELDLIVPEQLLVTDGGYLEAHVDIEASRLRFAAKGLRSDCLYLMPGFTGGSDKGETVLLGRNGSDYSAAVLAACVDAECCESGRRGGLLQLRPAPGAGRLPAENPLL